MMPWRLNSSPRHFPRYGDLLLRLSLLVPCLALVQLLFAAGRWMISAYKSPKTELPSFVVTSQSESHTGDIKSPVSQPALVVHESLLSPRTPRVLV